MTLFPQPLIDALAARPDHPAIEHGPRVVSCGDLLTLIGQAAAGLRAAGLGPGSSLAVSTATTPGAFAANVAAHALGCRVIGIRPGWRAPQFQAVLSGKTDALLGDASTLDASLVAHAGGAVVLSLPDVLAHAAVGPVPVEARPDDIARLNFTSGSTGSPKGCARTYRTFSLDYRPDTWAPDLARLVDACERFLLPGNLAVPVMFTFAARSLLRGGTVVIAERTPAALERHRITGFACTVPHLHELLRSLRDDPADLGSLRALVVSGSPASPTLLAAATDRLGPVIWQGYGQAESGMISLLTPELVAEHGDAALASVGRPLPEVEIRVMGGEICVRSPHAMAGYWDDPARTREVFVDGWLHTRDLGHVDDRGLLRLAGRTRDVIIVNAEVCYAGAVEAALAGHPDVDEAYVVGTPDDHTGEAIHAFVVLTPDRSFEPEALATHIRRSLTPNHVPTTFTALLEPPTTPSGKPDKQALLRRL